MTRREQFYRPDKYPKHWAFWGLVTLVVLGLLTIAPAFGLIALVLLVAVGIARWYGAL